MARLSFAALMWERTYISNFIYFAVLLRIICQPLKRDRLGISIMYLNSIALNLDKKAYTDVARSKY